MTGRIESASHAASGKTVADDIRLWSHTPTLSVMSSAKCDLLWGCSEIRTYKLKAFNDPEDADYFLDTIFDNGYLKKYRVRSSATRGPLVLKNPAVVL